MKSELNNKTAPGAKWRSRGLLLGIAVAWAGVQAGCIVVQDPPRAVAYPAEPVRQPVAVEQPAYEPQPVYAPQPVEVVNVYQQELSPYGHWVNTRYGQCWVYDNRPSGWQPYTVGHWISTDEGWCWVAEDNESSWGPTCYHYGRWYEDSSYGWVWVPGRVWGPSWVAWREGGGQCAWAPLPPECGDGQPVDVVVVDRYVQPRSYVSCDERYVAEPHVYQHVERNNVTIINRTTNITNITYVNNRVINRGVAVEHVQQRSGRAIQTESVTHVDNAADARRLVAQGRPVQYAPPAVERYAKAHPPAAPRALAPRPTPQPKPANEWPPQESSTARQGMPNHGVAQPPIKPQPRPRPEPEAQVEPRPRPPAEPKAQRPPGNYPPQESSTARQGMPNEGEPRPPVRPQPRPRPEPQPKGEPRPDPRQEQQPGQNPSAHPAPKQKPKPGQKPEEPPQ